MIPSLFSSHHCAQSRCWILICSWAAEDLIELPQGLDYESLTGWCVIIDPFTYTHIQTHTASVADGRSCRQMTAQTGNVWLGYAEQTLAATWRLHTAYICFPHQPVSPHLTPHSVSRSFFSPPRVYLPRLRLSISNLRVNTFNTRHIFTATCATSARLLSHQ